MLSFPTVPQVDLRNAGGVNATFANGSLTLNYVLGESRFVSITSSGISAVIVILDKATALQWHAPDITGSGTFGNFFSIGTNQRYHRSHQLC